jgi:nucleoside-diphosphate-sugar epimerase
MIHGPGNKGNLNLLYKIVKKGIPWPLASFDNQRSFCSIDNLSFVIRSIIEKNIESGIYHIADDQPVPTNELYSLIAEAQGKKARLLKINKSFISFFAKIGDILHLPLNSERLKKLTESYVVSNEKLKKALNIQKMPFDAKQGLIKTINSFNE